MRILPVRLSNFGSVAMYWREDAFRPAAVQERWRPCAPRWPNTRRARRGLTCPRPAVA